MSAPIVVVAPQPVVVVTEPTIVTVAAPGAQGPPGRDGPPGAAGAPGGAVYVHTQTVPASTWIVDHQLGRKVHLTLFDATDVVVFADITHGTPNQATVTFSTPTSGSALVS